MSATMDIDNVGAPQASPNTRILQAIQEAKNRGEHFLNPGGKLSASEMVALFAIVASVTPELSAGMGWQALLTLEGAYRKMDFTSVLSGAEESASESGPMTKRDSQDPFHLAFTGAYQGNGHQVFIDTLKDSVLRAAGPSMFAPYAMAISVVQSSGMGKSRMIQEASNLVFTLPINLRDELPKGTFAYPPADLKVREFFSEPGNKTDQRLQAEYTIFLDEMFSHTLKTIRGKGFRDSKNLAKDWASYLLEGQTTEGVGEHRQAFFDTIIAKTRARCETLPTPIDDQAITRLTDSLELRCRSLIEEIRSRKRSAMDEVWCIVSFDEAHGLTSPRGEPDEDHIKCAYQNLEKALTCIRTQPIFFAFLSTNSSLHRFIPKFTYASHPSAQSIRTDGKYLVPPFTKLSFDMYAGDYLSKQERHTLERMSTTEAMTVFGRGLWYNYHREWHHQRSENLDMTGERPFLESVIELAMNKLYPGANDPSVISNSHLAALGIRLGLTFSQLTIAARELESALVENHMRAVVVIPEHREYMLTCAPSEPILAEAAARRCDVIQNGPGLLEDCFRNGVLARGERVETTGRLLWTGAHDRALKTVPMSPGLTGPRYHLPIKVVDLLKSLFNPALHDNILKSKPVGNPDGPELQAAFENSFVFFSHFALAGDEGMLHVNNMYTALLRGMALYRPATQGSIDAVIPIHMGETTNEISPHTTSAINIQIKDRYDYCPIDRSITVPNKEIPALSVIMHLGDPQGDGRSELVKVHGPEIIPELSSNSSSYQEGQEDNHYSIVVYGHGPKTYSVIPDDKEAVYDRILAEEDLLQDFPRGEHEENVALVEGMKPYFKGGTDSHTFDWFERD